MVCIIDRSVKVKFTGQSCVACVYNPILFFSEMPKRIYRKYEEGEAKDNLQKALAMIKSGQISRTKAAKQFKIAKGTLINKLNKLHQGKRGHPFVLTKLEEESIVAHILKVSEWGFPFNRRDLQHLVSDFLNRKGVTIPQFKEGNIPTLKWTSKFIKRHEVLTHRLSQNIKTSKAEISPDDMVQYFNALKITLSEENGELIDPARIYNYDETNLADDPGRRKYIFKKGTKYPDRIKDSSKASVSVMFCGSASGFVLAPYVVYKSENIWSTWMEGGPPNTRYNRSKSGWFDSTIFSDWFCKLFVPAVRKHHKDKKIAVLGDNLASHFSPEVLKCAEQNNIVFACFPKNSTHLCQPLDVGFYAPLKRKWRDILDTWKSTQRNKSQILQKDQFPRLLKKLFLTACPNNYSENLISGFKQCGIVPFNPDAVINRLPKANTEEGLPELVSDVVVDILKNMRYGNKDIPKKRKRSRISVPPGQGIVSEDLHNKVEIVNASSSGQANLSEDLEIIDAEEPGPSTSKKKKNRKVNIDSESENSEDIPYNDSSDDSCWKSWQIKEKRKFLEEVDNSENNEESEDENINAPLAVLRQTLRQEKTKLPTDLSDNDYVLVGLDTTKGTKKYYVAQIISSEASPDGDEYEAKFLRNKNSKFIWPPVEDRSFVSYKQIVQKLSQPTHTKRGLHFQFLKNCNLKVE